MGGLYFISFFIFSPFFFPFLIFFAAVAHLVLSKARALLHHSKIYANKVTLVSSIFSCPVSLSIGSLATTFPDPNSSAHHLQPIVTKLTSYIKDATHFLNKLNNIGQLPNGVLLVTLDVASPRDHFIRTYPTITESKLAADFLPGQTEKSYYQDYKTLRSYSIIFNQ